MSRELPYFKFFTGEWLNGDITLLEYDLQGVFINVCAYYWHRECEMDLDKLIRKFGQNKIIELMNEGLICQLSNSDQVVIKFLDEQFIEFTNRKQKLSEAGKKGQLIKNQTKIKPPLNNPLTLIEDKSKIIEDNIKKVLLSDLTVDNVLLDNEYHKITFEWFKLFKKNILESGLTNTTTIDRSRLYIWSDEIRKLIEIDKRTKDEIRKVYKFLETNDFWKKNVRSTMKLREKFEQLYLQSNEQLKPKPIASNSGARTTNSERKDFE